MTSPLWKAWPRGRGGLHTADPHCDTLFYRSLRPVTMNEWHWVRVSRTGLQGMMEIDAQPVSEGLARGGGLHVADPYCDTCTFTGV